MGWLLDRTLIENWLKEENWGALWSNSFYSFHELRSPQSLRRTTQGWWELQHMWIQLLKSSYLNVSNVLCSRTRFVFPVRSRSCKVAGRDSGIRISVKSLQLRSTNWEENTEIKLILNSLRVNVLLYPQREFNFFSEVNEIYCDPKPPLSSSLGEENCLSHTPPITPRHHSSAQKYLYLRQLQYFWENANVVGVRHQSVQPFAVCDGRGDGFKLVAT